MCVDSAVEPPTYLDSVPKTESSLQPPCTLRARVSPRVAAQAEVSLGLAADDAVRDNSHRLSSFGSDVTVRATTRSCHDLYLCERGECRRCDQTLSRCVSVLARSDHPWPSSLLGPWSVRPRVVPLIEADFCSSSRRTTVVRAFHSMPACLPRSEHSTLRSRLRAC